MRRHSFFQLVGIGGVSDHETDLARRWSHHFDIALFPVAIFALLAWYDNKHNVGQTILEPAAHAFADWLLWLFFVAEMVVMSCLCRAPWRYLRHNWFNAIIIITTMPLLWNQQELAMLRAVRFLLLIFKMAQLSHTIRIILSRNSLGITVMIAWVFVLFSGVLMAMIEPNFKSAWDGIWWAWVTVTTVGYGDIVPITGTGRVLAGIVMLIGMGLFSLITANFSAFFVSREEQKLVNKEERVLAKEEKVLEKEVQVLVGEQKILHHLQQIENRLHALEQQLKEQRANEGDT